jgi:AmpD protein
MQLDSERAWFSEVNRCDSPNCDDRPLDCGVELIVVHGISLPPGRYGEGFVHQLFTNTLDPTHHPYFAQIADLRVSAHLLIERDGLTTQFVALNRRAWHAGESSYRGRSACNDFSVGIELEGVDDQPYAERQYERLADIIAALAVAWPLIDQSRVVGHRDVSPGRKTDPGSAFDWTHLHEQLDKSTREPHKRG